MTAETLADDLFEEATTGLRPDPVQLLDDLCSFLRRFVAFGSEHQVVAVALWVVHTWGIEAAEATPYLGITSAERRSGKTRLLESLELLVRNPLSASNTSEAALFRAIDREPTTVLFDELDAVFGAKTPREELRSLLNAGHRRGAKVFRMGGKNNTELQAFDPFGAKALAAIGELPTTVADRCIPIRLARRAPGERVEKFRRREAQREAGRIAQGLAAWTEANLSKLAAARPQFPDVGNDRAEDGWEPLLGVADLAGGDWPMRARAAMVALHGEQPETEPSVGMLLLAHVRDAFDAANADRLTTAELLGALCEREDGPWAEWWSKAVREGDSRAPGNRLARILRPFGIAPRDLRTDTGVRKGYVREEFEDAWARYLSTPAPHFRDSKRDNTTLQVDGHSETRRPETVSRFHNGPEQGSSVVASQNAQTGRKPESGPSREEAIAVFEREFGAERID